MAGAAGLLGTHVGGRAHGHAGLRELLLVGRQRLRDPEIGHQRLAVGEQDVLRLDITVDHPVAVGVIERERHLARDPDRVLDR